MPNGNDNNEIKRCVFCGKTQDQVDTLITGPHAAICNECVELCNTMLNPEPKTANQKKNNAKRGVEIKNKPRTPHKKTASAIRQGRL